MTAPATPAGPVADRRLGPYTVLVVAGLLAALVTGQAAFAAIAAPAGALVVLGLADRRPLTIELVSADAPPRVLEGDRWCLRIELRWSGDAELDLLHGGVPGHVLLDGAGRVVDAAGGVTIEIEAVADRWGRHGLGHVEVRARRPRGMLRWDQRIELPGAIRVLPAASRLDELLRPQRARVAAGGHITSVRGPGTDFADLRPYVPGDRLRDVSWTASARSESPWVVVHHPERTGTVLVLLDGFVEVGVPAGSLDRAARVVWSIARHHLEAGDRVGLLAIGSAPTWLSPVAGRRARWQVLDALLAVGTTLTGSALPTRRRPHQRRHTEPAASLGADAVVVGVSPLQSDAFVAEVLHHRRLGRSTVVVGVEAVDLLPPAVDELERAARRLWALDTEIRCGNLSRAGVPSVVVGDDPAPAIRLLASRPARPTRRPA